MEERKNEYLETAKFNVDENIYYLVAELSRTKDKMKALNILRDAFSKELGAMTYELVDDGQPVGSAMSGLSTCPQNNQTAYVKFVNTKDEGFLYPHLELLLREMVEEECWPDRKKRVLSYIDAFMKMWEEGRNNQASQEQQKRPQEATNGHTPSITPQEQKTAAEPKELKDLLPDELNTDEAKAYFKKAVELGLMTGDFKWLKGLQMLACFAREMSRKLNLGKGERLSWKPFETLFGVHKGKLRLNLNDIQNKGQEPKEAYLIDKIFE